jgi:hypothetical protein
MEPKKTRDQLLSGIRMTMKREDIMTFVSGLHDIQMDMIECAVIKKEREGFPEANSVIKHIMELK